MFIRCIEGYLVNNQVDEFVKAVTANTPEKGSLLQLRYGLVTDTTTGVTVTIAGETVEDVPVLDHVTVHDNDFVAMLSVGGDLLIIGVTLHNH